VRYHALMPTLRSIRVAFACAVSALAIVASAPAAIAAPAPLRADIRVGRPIDIVAFEQSVARRYHIQFRKIVEADIDRDGDLDVVAATDRGFIVWVNDGRGHLISQPPAHRPVVSGMPGDPVWHGDSGGVAEPIQTDPRPAPVAGPSAHAPTSFASTEREIVCAAPPVAARVIGRSPRAPPA